MLYMLECMQPKKSQITNIMFFNYQIQRISIYVHHESRVLALLVLNHFSCFRCHDYWEKRLQEERKERLRQVKKHWDQQCQAALGFQLIYSFYVQKNNVICTLSLWLTHSDFSMDQFELGDTACHVPCLRWRANQQHSIYIHKMFVSQFDTFCKFIDSFM